MATISGTLSAEVLLGTPLDDVLVGHEGDDLLQGDAGSDTYSYIVGDGSDTISDSSGTNDRLLIVGNLYDAVRDIWHYGNDLFFLMEDGAVVRVVNQFTDQQLERIEDTEGHGFNLLQGLSGGVGNDVIIGTVAGEILSGGDGDDVISADAGDDTAEGGAGDDVLYGLDGTDLLSGGPGVDLAYGDSGNDTVDGGDGNDELHGGDGDDILIGELGADVEVGEDGNDRISGNEGNDTLIGLLGNDTEWGDDGDDRLSGNEGNDWLEGGAGSDTMWGDSGADTLIGGLGNDWLEGGDDDDRVSGDDGADTIVAGEGNDSAWGDAGDDHISGNGGNDRLEGLAGNDTIWGDAGADTITGGAGADWLEGGDGDDRLSGNEDGDTIVAGQGNDLAWGDSGDDRISGSDGNDFIDGGADNDTLWGDAGADTLVGGTGNDALDGGDGDDLISGNDGADTIVGGEGNDQAWGDADVDMISGNGGNDILHGGDGDDFIWGDAGADTILGDAGADTLRGGDGADTITGRAGNDFIDGGADTDTAVYSGNFADYAITTNLDGSISIVDTRSGSPDGSDTVANVEFLTFADGTVPVSAAPNDPPVITSNGGGSSASVSVAENSTAVTTVTATDPDAGQTLTFSISGGADASKFTINASTGALAFVTSPNFEVPTDSGANNVYDVIVQVSDGHGGTDTQAIAVTVTDQNEPPVITSNGGGASASVSVGENSAAVTTVTASDPDAGQTLTFSIVGGADAGKFTINASTGALAFVAAPNFEAPTDADSNNVYDVTVQVSDGNGGTDTQAIAVTVTDQNEFPVITSNGGGASASVSMAENATAVTTVTASDPDAGQTLTYSIAGGADQSKFTINSSTGALSFVAAPNFEAPTDAGANNIYDVTVQVSDGHGGTVTQAIAVTVTDQNEAPAITSNGGGATASVSVAENTTAVTTVTATDPDAGQTLTFSIVGGADQSKFTINPTTGALAFAAAPNFEAPTDAGANNVYDVTVQVSDGNGGSDTQAIAVTVTDQNELPVITSNGGGASASVSVAENTTAVTTITASDPDAGQTLTYSIVGGADQSKFTINPTTGALAFAAAPNFEAPTDSGGDNVYDVTVQVSDGHGGTDTQAIAVTVTDQNEPPVITSNGGSASASVSVAEDTTAVTTVVASDPDAGQTLTYSIVGGADQSKFTINSSTGALSFVTAPDFGNPTDVGGDNVYDVTVEVSDGHGSSDTQAIAVTVTNQNTPPTITSNGGGASASVPVAENTTAVTTVTASDPDAGQTLTFSIVGGADQAKFTVNPTTGALSFIAAPNFEAPTDTGANNVYDVTVQVSDGSGGTDTQTIAVTVTNVSGNFVGDSDDNILVGTDEEDSISGLAGNDVITGKAGNDVLDGGADFDIVDYTDATSGVSVNLAGGTAVDGEGGTDSLSGFEGIIGSGHDDTLTGDGGDNVILGLAGADTISGGSGDDDLEGGAGADQLDGGANTSEGDFATYVASVQGVTVDLGLHTAHGGDAEGDVLTNIENLEGSPVADTLTGDAGPNILAGLDGDDTLSGGGGGDTLIGGSGADTLDGGAGSDTASGDDGDDTYRYTLGAGLDQLFDSSGTDRIVYTGNVEDDVQDIARGGAGGENLFITFSDAAAVTILGHFAATPIERVEDTAGHTYNLLTGLTGTAQSDVIVGTDAGETLTGGAGRDALFAHDGADTVVGGTGDDFLKGGLGNDVYTFAPGDGQDTINDDGGTDRVEVQRPFLALTGATRTGDDVTLTFYNPAGDDTITIEGQFAGSGKDIEAIRLASPLPTFPAFDWAINPGFTGNSGAGLHDEIFVGTDNNDTINAGDGYDYLFGNGGDDVLNGGDGDDILTGGPGADALIGGNQTGIYFSGDFVNYADSPAAVTVNLATQTATGGDATGDTLSGIEGVIGSDAADTLTGSNAANSFEIFIGLAGNDIISGGGGTDRADYRLSPAAVTVNLATGVALDGYGTTDALTGVEEVVGSRFNDVLTGGNPASDGFERFRGGAGNDTIDGGSGFDEVDYVSASSAVIVNLANHSALDGDGGTDSLFNIEAIRASYFADTLVGDAANNRFRGLAGNDSIDGGGNTGIDGDVVDYSTDAGNNGTGAVTVNLAAGTAIDGWGNTDTLVNIESATGSPFNDTLTGNDNANTLDGGGGVDTLSGAGGDDRLRGGAGADTLDGGAGFDFASYFTAAAGVTADLANTAANTGDAFGDTYTSIEGLLGSNFDDDLRGDGTGNVVDGSDFGNDRLDGRGGDDFVFGNAGNDTLIGGIGNDTLNGGTGNDRYEFTVGDGNDTITDIGGDADVVVFSGATTLDGATANRVGDDLVITYTGGQLTIVGQYAGNTIESIVDDEGTTFNLLAGLTGTAGNDVLVGTDAVNDVLNGGGGHDVLFGNGGNDDLTGGTGDDDLFGGTGNDSYHYAVGDGSDHLSETNAGGTDSLHLNLLVRGFDGAERVNGTSVGSDLLLTFADGGQILLENQFDDLNHPEANIESVVFDRALYIHTRQPVSFSILDAFTGGSDNEFIVGTSNADTINGNAGEDYLFGGAGNDTLNGGGGDDIILGGPGGDTIDGGPQTGIALGGDFVSYRTSASGVTINLATGFADGGDATGDVITNVEGVYGSPFHDVLTGGFNDNFEFFQGGDGDDTINGGSGFDAADWRDAPSGVSVNLALGTALDGYGHTDTLTGIEFIRGSAFNDTLIGSNASGEWFRGNEGDDFINGGAGARDAADYITSLAGVSVNLATGSALDGFGGTDTLVNIEAIRGSAFDDTLVGGPGQNYFRGLNGNDTITGTGDNDFVDYSTDASFGGAAPVSVNLGTGNAIDGFGATDTLINVSGVVGTSGNDTLIGSSDPSRFEFFVGGAGNDTINGGNTGDGNDLVEYDNSPIGVSVNLATGVASDGFGGNDTLSGIEWVYGSPFNDVLTGGNPLSDSFERFTPFGGNDTVDGGSGFDWIDYAQGRPGGPNLLANVTVDLGAGTATGAEIGSDTLISIEAVRGTPFGDFLTGGSGNETFRGLAGADTIDGGGGVDRVEYTNDADFGGLAGVSVNLSSGTAVDGFGSTDTLLNIENVRGTESGDTIIGSTGANTLDGRGGNDTINGGAGNDTLIGGSGDDLFVFADGTGNDTINDFTPGAGSVDKLDLTAFHFADFNALLAATTDNGGNAPAVIQLDGDDSVTLLGVRKIDLHPDDVLL